MGQKSCRIKHGIILVLVLFSLLLVPEGCRTDELSLDPSLMQDSKVEAEIEENAQKASAAEMDSKASEEERRRQALAYSVVYEETVLQKEAAAEPGTIGEPAETAKAIRLTNRTGKTIVVMALAEAGSVNYGDNLLAEREIFRNEELRIFYLDPASGSSVLSDAVSAEEGLDLCLIFEDGSMSVLHEVPFEQMTSAELLMEEEAYLEYRNETDERVNTQEWERSGEKKKPRPIEIEEPLVVEPENGFIGVSEEELFLDEVDDTGGLANGIFKERQESRPGSSDNGEGCIQNGIFNQGGRDYGNAFEENTP